MVRRDCCRREGRLGRREPQNGEMAPELFEVAIGGNERCVVQGCQRRSHRVDVGDSVQGFDLAGFDRLRKIDRKNSNRKLGKVGESIPGRLFAVPLPGDIEDLAPVHNRSQQECAHPSRCLKQSLNTARAWAVIQQGEYGACIEDVGLGHRYNRSFSILCSRSQASSSEGPPLNRVCSLRMISSTEGEAASLRFSWSSRIVLPW